MYDRTRRANKLIWVSWFYFVFLVFNLWICIIIFFFLPLHFAVGNSRCGVVNFIYSCKQGQAASGVTIFVLSIYRIISFISDEIYEILAKYMNSSSFSHFRSQKAKSGTISCLMWNIYLYFIILKLFTNFQNI
jgi:hypothetical protein